MPFFAVFDYFSATSGFLGGLAIGTVATIFWLRYQHKKALSRLRSSLGRTKKNKLLGPSVENNEISQLINEIFELKKKCQQREKRFRKVGKRLNSVLNNMDVGVLVLDVDHQVIFSNASSRELLGVSAEDLKNRLIHEIVRNPEIDEAISLCLSKENEVETEFETTRGPKRTLQVRVSQMPRKSKAQTMLVLVDVSNLRQLENMRRDFVANVSHELKTPLASIKAYSETLRRGAIDDTTNRMGFIHTIEEQANRLHQLIIDLIHLARIEQGKTAFVITDVELTSIVVERIEAYSASASQSNISLELKSPETEIWIRADEEGVQTIIDNLLSNAIRYTPADGEISVVCQQTESSAILEVIDTGIGIAPDQQERIFERFYRVDKARSREMGGTGLGLSIVKHLTQSMGGKISVNSSVGIGSKFSVDLPLVEGDAEDN